MKKILFLFLLLFASGEVYCAGYEKILTEDASIQSALNINPDILLQSQSVEFANHRIKEAQSLYMPKIDFNLNASRFNNMEPMILANQLSPVPIYLPDEKKDIYFSTRLSIWQSVYAGGRIRATNKLAEMNMNKAKNDSTVVKNSVVNKVKSVFNTCLFFKEKLSISGAALEKAETLKAGKDEIMNLQMKNDLMKFNYEKELLSLLNVIGLELDTIVMIEGSFTPKIKKFDLNQCILWAYQFRPEMQSTQYQESIDGLMVNLLSMQRFPTISIGAGQEWLGDRVIGDESSWYVSINANLPIFDGGAGFARVKQGKVSAREATLKRSKMEDQVRLQVNTAFAEYNFWKNQATKMKVIEKDPSKSPYTESELEIIYNLNKSYYALELAVGIQLDSY